MSADGEVATRRRRAAGDLDGALARWGDAFAAAARVGPIRRPPTAWCSWYHYFERVTQGDVEENLQAVGDLGLAVDVVQIDDGYQAEIGDWLLLSDRFASLGGGRRPHPGGRAAGRHLGGAVPGGRALRARPRPPRLAGGRCLPGTGWGEPDGCTPSTPRTRRRRPTCARCSAPSATWASTTSRSTSSTPVRWRGGGPTPDATGGGGLPPGAADHPRGDRHRRLPARLRGADPAQRRAGRRHADRTGHRPPRRAARRRPVPALPAGGGAEQPLAGVAARAGSGSTTPTASSPARTSSDERTGPPSWSGTAASG